MSWAPIFGDLLDSSVWSTPPHVRLAWIAILASKHWKTHIAELNVYRLHRKAGISMEEAQEAYDILSSPDPVSYSQEHEGRRILPVDGGWYVVQGEKYRMKIKRALSTERVRDFREKIATESETPVPSVPEVPKQPPTPPEPPEDPYPFAANDSEIAAPNLVTDQAEKAPVTKETKKPRASQFSYPADFESLWVLYPNKKSKYDGYLASKSLTKDLREKIEADLKVRVNTYDWTKEGGRFVPALATYLRKRRWEDSIVNNKATSRLTL